MGPSGRSPDSRAKAVQHLPISVSLTVVSAGPSQNKYFRLLDYSGGNRDGLAPYFPIKIGEN